MGVEPYKIGYHAILSKGKIEENDATSMIISEVPVEWSLEQKKEAISILKKIS